MNLSNSNAYFSKKVPEMVKFVSHPSEVLLTVTLVRPNVIYYINNFN
jgi:hypothetical protein